MDFIENDGGGITPSVERHAGELIAALHATKRERFGYARDTLIGPLPQPNPQTDTLGAVLPRSPPVVHGAAGAGGGRVCPLRCLAASSGWPSGSTTI